MLKHLSRSGINFHLHIFIFSWSSHPFFSIWKISSTIPIHKMTKPLDSPAFFQHISHISCLSKFWNALFYQIYCSTWDPTPISLPVRPVSAQDALLSIKFFIFLSPIDMGLTNSKWARYQKYLVFNSFFSPRQAGMCAGHSALNQILHIFQSIWHGFDKFKMGSQTILATFDFFKAYNSVWHPAIFHKLVPAGPHSCFVDWIQFFFSDRRAGKVFQHHKSRSFRVG